MDNLVGDFVSEQVRNLRRAPSRHLQHVRRRIVYQSASEFDPVRIEQELMRIIPEKDWLNLSHLLIFHGRAICDARKPRCEACTLAQYCPSARRI